MIIKKLDIHAHVLLEKTYPCMAGGQDMGLTCEELRGMYDKIGVEKGVALPLVSPEHMSDQFTNREARIASEMYPKRLAGGSAILIRDGLKIIRVRTYQLF